jgi:general secretion pathway protein D
VIVQGRASELLEVSKLIERIDKDESSSVSRMQVFKLKQAVAEELAATINAAIQAVINPPQQTTGTGGFGFGGGGQGAQELRDNKSVALEFLTSSGGVKELIKSGILADVRVSSDIRSNSLLVTAPESSMGLMEALIAELDRAPDAVSEIKVFTLKNADAEQSVAMLETLFENTNQEEQLGIQIAGTEGSSSSLIPLRFSADIRTNTVLAVGSAESLSVVEAILLRLDSDDARQRQTEVFPLRNAPAEVVATTLLNFLEQQTALQDSAEDLISNIERIRQEVLVSPDTNSNSLIISASPQYFSQIVEIIETLDAQPPEVVIQALLVEVTLDATDEFGIELGFQDPLLLERSTTSTISGVTSIAPGLNFNNVSAQLGNNSGTGTNPGTVATQGLSNFALNRTNADLGFGGLVFSAQSDSISVLLRALASRRTVQVLSRPQVRATHNNEAYVTVGQQIPVTNGVTISAQGIAQPQIIQQQTGITLRVTPRITPDGIIAMNVFADKSSLSPVGVPIFVNATTGDTVNSPIINQSQAVTTVNVPNGQTIVIGGMITKSDGTLERKVPWLGDLPIVGKAFRYDGTTTSRTELLIFLTPRIVLSDLDSELIKQVEAERLHFVESEAEEVHGPLYSVPATSGQFEHLPPEGTILSPDTPVDELLMQPVPQEQP